MKIEAEDVVRFLKDQPDFFEQHISVLLDLNLPNLHDEKAISLSEYQVVALREKNALLESKLRELIKFGEENDDNDTRVGVRALLGVDYFFKKQPLRIFLKN